MSKSILIIEDNKKHQLFLERLLKSEGFQVETARNGKEVEKKMQEAHRFDLVTVDVLVPQFDATKFIQTHFNGYGEDALGPKLLVVSAYADSEEYVEQWPEEIKRIRKPFDYDDLLKEIMRILPEDKSRGKK